MTAVVCTWIIVVTIGLVLMTGRKRRKYIPRPRHRPTEYQRIRNVMINMRRSPYAERGPRIVGLPQSRIDRR